MKKTMTNYLLGSMALLSILLVSSCGDDEKAVPAPEASFTIEKSGKTITVTNNSTDGETYAWDFGDGSGTSTDENPDPYTYTANASYIVKLTVTNATGDDASQVPVDIINVAIDGDLSDWDDIEYAVQYSSGEGNSITGMKLENLANNKLFLYIEGTEDLSSLTQIFLNTDNDRTTGADIGWRYFQAGEDYLVEGTLLAGDDQAYSLFQCDGCTPAAWDWTDLAITDFVDASELVTVTGGKAYELSFDLTIFPTTISSEAIGIGVMDLLDWAEFGQMPQYYNEETCAECTLYNYTLK